MFDGYRKLLKIVCSKNWNADENYDEMKKFLSVLESALGNKPEPAVLLNLLQKLLQKAFNETERDLLYLAINAIIELDEILEKDGAKVEKIVEKLFADKPKERIEGESELPVEKEKVPEKQIKEEEDEVLSRSYGTLIKRSAVKEVLPKIKKDFSLNDLEEIITDYYRNVLKSKVNDRGLSVYASSYKRFLIDFGLCRRDDIPERPPPKKSAVIYHLTGKDVEDLKKPKKPEKIRKKIGRSSLSNQAQYIILWAEKNGTDIVDIDALYQHKLHPIGENYRMKDIYAGLDELVEEGIATRFGKKRYTIKREMLKKE